MKKLFTKGIALPALVLVLASCTSNLSNAPSGGELTTSDREQIRALIGQYVTGWLTSDTAMVLDIFADTATIIPRGMAPKKGKAALREFWFPADSSVTTIHSYEVNVLEIGGNTDLAYTLEAGQLSFSYQKGDLKLSRESNAHATTILRKSGGGQWKVVQRMWTDRR
ncbi:YybH family protein [Flavilitoribacter nigricans]|uniref:DUF4440 domain-containing protein n=1 Tax=Flavilitoribacter nigricans (strain ATCC 23147 / DSM 23189 / NBRC 102662 / NCIMB 1420 / SS-2) TaxID=1122177 RepID=A0A2D0N6L6_FLAN2|nr:DUF4440 domain-containing protein [Flavilitoribacter nigricans]PHN04135.1 hypothetical protein CRP01_23345 [Flavilitoribacter nigricans DSM 23189 = NBRC 102662]